MADIPLWQDIISPDELPILRSFYQELLPDLFNDISGLFQGEQWQKLYTDWNCPEWLSLYGSSFPVIFSSLELVGDIKSPAPDIQPQEMKKLIITLFSVLKALKDGIPKDQEEAATEYIKSVVLPFRLQLLVALNQMICQFKYGEPIQALMEKANHNDINAMLNLIKVDKSFLEYEPIKKKIRYSYLFHDSWFLGKLAQAIKVDYLKSKTAKIAIDDLALPFFWALGFYDKTLAVFNDFLWDIGMERFDNDKALGKRLERMGLTKFPKHDKNS
jgi:hypothetical protein